MHFGDCERNVFQYLRGERSTLLVWNLRVQHIFETNSYHGQDR